MRGIIVDKTGGKHGMVLWNSKKMRGSALNKRDLSLFAWGIKKEGEGGSKHVTETKDLGWGGENVRPRKKKAD